MTTDTMCSEAVKRGYITVDYIAGIAYANRFRGKKMGCTNKGGYQVATLHLDGERKQIKLHRLIWIAANGLPKGGLQIDHINRNKRDNRLRNLRIADGKLNSNNRRDYSGSGNPAAKINQDIANLIRSEYPKTKSYRKLALKYRVSKSLIAQIVRRELWHD